MNIAAEHHNSVGAIRKQADSLAEFIDHNEDPIELADIESWLGLFEQFRAFR